MKSLLLFLLSGLSCTAIAQGSKLSGKYLYTFPDGNGMTLSFNDGFFTKHTGGHMVSTTSKGTYQFKENKLVLNLEKGVNPDTSLYKIKEKNDINTGSITMTIHVTDYSNKMPFSFAYCTFRDKDYKPLIIIHTDSLGKANMNINDFRLFHTLSIDYLGYERVDILLSKYINQSIEIEVSLKPQNNYYIEEGKESYKVEKLTAKELILISDGGERMVFKKI